MGFMKPKVRPDPQLEAQKAAERANRIDQGIQSIDAESMRLFNIFGKRSLLSGGLGAMPGAQGATGGGGFSKGTL